MAYPRDAGGVASLPFAALRKPVIAAVNGPAVGIGATLTLPMDIRIAAESARFGFVFGRVGIVPEAASSWFLPRVVGISQAIEWVATGRVFDAAEALHGTAGLPRPSRTPNCCPPRTQVAREIADNTSGAAVAASRQLLWSMLGAASPWDAHRAESRALVELGDGPDSAEGVSAFLEKRPPQFTAPLTDVVPRWPEPPDDVVPWCRTWCAFTTSFVHTRRRGRSASWTPRSPCRSTAQKYTLPVDHRTTLLDALRERLASTGTKKGSTTVSAAPARCCSTDAGWTAVWYSPSPVGDAR